MNEESKRVEVVSKVLQKNDDQADLNRKYFKDNNLFAINIMSSPGSGKTTFLESIATNFKEFSFGVIEGDVETDNDAKRLISKGVKSYQITTGQTCHLDSFLVKDAYTKSDFTGLDFVFIENIGNLICPASYDLGAFKNVVLLSVTEGDDKPAKYPKMFRVADLVIISKIDIKEHFDFDSKKAVAYAKELNPNVKVIEISSKSGYGLDQCINYFIKSKKEW